MSIQTKEARIILAIEAIRISKRMSRRRAAKLYKVPETTLRDRINGVVEKANVRPPMQKLTTTEEDAIVQYILDLDSRGFPPRLDGVEDMANLLLATRQARADVPPQARLQRRSVRRQVRTSDPGGGPGVPDQARDHR